MLRLILDDNNWLVSCLLRWRHTAHRWTASIRPLLLQGPIDHCTSGNRTAIPIGLVAGGINFDIRSALFSMIVPDNYFPNATIRRTRQLRVLDTKQCLPLCMVFSCLYILSYFSGEKPAASFVPLIGSWNIKNVLNLSFPLCSFCIGLLKRTE